MFSSDPARGSQEVTLSSKGARVLLPRRSHCRRKARSSFCPGCHMVGRVARRPGCRVCRGQVAVGHDARATHRRSVPAWDAVRPPHRRPRTEKRFKRQGRVWLMQRKLLVLCICAFGNVFPNIIRGFFFYNRKLGVNLPKCTFAQDQQPVPGPDPDPTWTRGWLAHAYVALQCHAANVVFHVLLPVNVAFRPTALEGFRHTQRHN